MAKKDQEFTFNIKIQGKFFGNLFRFFHKIFVFLKVLLKVIYWILLVSFPLFALYFWKFKYSEELLNYLKVLTWPLIVVTFIFIFKEEIGNFLNEMSEISLFGGKAKRERTPPQQKVEGSKNPDAENYSLLEEYKSLSSNLSNNVETLKKDLSQRDIELDFERIYVLIFRSQMYLLKLLNDAGSLSLDYLQQHYAQVQKINRGLENWPLAQYLTYLFNNGLMEIKEDRYLITEKGKFFINYIENVRKYLIDAKTG